MLLDIEVNPEQYDEIMEFIKAKKYQDPQQFIQIAIKNLIVREKAGTININSNDSFTITDIVYPSNEIKDIFQNFIVHESWIPEYWTTAKIEESNEWKPRPLIWKFYTRFFPVKLVVCQLATICAEQKSNWVGLEKLQDQAYKLSLAFANKLREYEEKKNLPRHQRLSTGLPATEQIKEGKRGKAVTKALAKIEASRKRFISQFIGRWIKKEDKQTKQKQLEFEPGACIEMGLIGYEIDDNSGDMFLTLTKEGKEFALLKNPIINNDMSKVFSEEEVKFILRKIIPRFKLEHRIVNKILQKYHDSHQLTSEQINDIFEEEKEKFIDEYHDETLVNNLQLFKNIKSLNECPKCGKKELLHKENIDEIQCQNKKCGYKIVNPNIPERVATMGRLSELGLVEWKIDSNGKSIYSLINNLKM